MNPPTIRHVFLTLAWFVATTIASAAAPVKPNILLHGVYAATIKNLDDNVGRILAHLHALGLDGVPVTNERAQYV